MQVLGVLNFYTLLFGVMYLTRLRIMAVGVLPCWPCNTPLSTKVGTKFADQWQSLSRYSSLADWRPLRLVLFCLMRSEFMVMTETKQQFSQCKVQSEWDPRRDRWRANSKAYTQFLRKGHCSQKICPGRLGSQFTYYCVYVSCVIMCEDLTLNFGNRRTGCCIMMTHCFTSEFFYQKAATLTQLRWPRQNYTWGTHSQNTTSKMYLKHGRSTGNSAYAWEGTTLRAMVASRPKFSVWPDGSTSPKNYESECSNH
jgi:hypothetical protein